MPFFEIESPLQTSLAAQLNLDDEILSWFDGNKKKIRPIVLARRVIIQRGIEKEHLDDDPDEMFRCICALNLADRGDLSALRKMITEREEFFRDYAEITDYDPKKYIELADAHKALVEAL